MRLLWEGVTYNNWGLGRVVEYLVPPRRRERHTIVLSTRVNGYYSITIHVVGEHHLQQIFRERRSATATVARAGKGVCVRLLP